MVKPTKRTFDFTKFKQRHIALKILYFGWDHDGLAAQLDNKNTIEYHLFNSLTKSCLIESREGCSYNRCGRTDKGVSSYGQVVNLNVRSNLTDETDPQNVGLFTPENYTGTTDKDSPKYRCLNELNYVEILNRLLPDHIKAIAWAPVGKDFSSRFSCQSRSYSYIFPKGDLCIQSIERALIYLVGQHDFRNMCSFDLKNGVTNHTRTILAAYIKPLRYSINHQTELTSVEDDSYSYYEVVIVGQAFLYHQIRCIMSILFLVGTKKEAPEVVKDLLDIEKCPARPNFTKASPSPLCLFDCKYDEKDLPLGWLYDQNTIYNLLKQIKKLWTQYKTKTLMIERVLFDLESSLKTSDNNESANPDQCVKRIKLGANRWRDFGLECDNMSESKYVQLLNRSRDETLESKLKVIEEKKKRIDSSLLSS